MKMKSHTVKLGRIFLLCAILIGLLVCCVSATAEMSCVQAYVDEGLLVVTTTTPWDDQGLTCSISSQSADVLATGTFGDEDTTVKTTVLVDISTSIPSAMRADLVEMLQALVAEKPTNEEMCLVTVGESLTVLQDFTADRYDLSKALESIQFNGTQSKIYDGIYNTMPPISTQDGQPVFYRTIVVTDGLDDTNSGITKEELYLTLQSQQYPIDVVAVTVQEEEENKELAALVRISNGRYTALWADADWSVIIADLSVADYGYGVMEIPSSLLDGVVRQVDLSDGASQASVDIKFPVYATEEEIAPAEEIPVAETVETEAEETPDVEAEKPEEEKEDDEITSTPEPTWLETNLILVLCGAGGLVVVVLVVVLIVSLKKKQKKALQQQRQAEAPDLVHFEHTVVTNEVVSNDAVHEPCQFTIQLSQPNHPERKWTLPVSHPLRIGRGGHCDVQIDENTVSREQCQIMVCQGNLALFHVSTSNKTRCNGVVVEESCWLQSGDMLKFGHASLQVNYIQRLDDAGTDFQQPTLGDCETTEYVF